MTSTRTRQMPSEWWTLQPKLNHTPTRAARTRRAPGEWWKVEQKAEEEEEVLTLPVDREVAGETWKQHPEWGVMVSDLGRVLLARGAKSHGNNNGRGYMRVTLRHPETHKVHQVSVHRLVMEAHCSRKRYETARRLNLVVNHINGLPGDNRLVNLEFCSARENTSHYWETIYPTRRKERVKKAIRDGKATRPIYLVSPRATVRIMHKRITAEEDGWWMRQQGYL